MEEAQFRAELALSSRYDGIELACVVLDESLRQYFPEFDGASRIELALREALANAIRHGNTPDAEEYVNLEMTICGDELRIRVSDRGGGFDPESVEDAGIEENLLKLHGRGIFAMRQCMDSVSFSPRDGGGTTVTMSRKLT